jgi:hypothetical protein
MVKDLWLSVGYQINGLDQDDFTNDRAVVSGIYFRLRYKFDEEMIHFLRDEFLTLKGVRFFQMPSIQPEPIEAADIKKDTE